MNSNTAMTPTKAIIATQDRFLAIAPPNMKFEAEKGFALQALKNNDFLAATVQKDIVSFQMAITNVAAIGLSLNPAEKLAYLLPRKGKVCLDVSYMGMMKLATDSGSIEWVQANMVCANDSFTDNGPGNRPDHSFNSFAKPSERGEWVGAYCVAKTPSGDYLTTTMTIDELKGIQARSEAGKQNKGPWITDFAEQCKKTVVRRAFKMWPRSTGMERLTAAVDISNTNEGFEPIITNPNIEEATDEQSKYFNQLIEQSDSAGMFVFSRTVPPSVMVSLYGSFPAGKKTEFKNIVRQLEAEGAATVNEWIASINDCAGDASVIIDFTEQYPQDVISYVRDQLTPEAAHFFDEVVEGE